MLEPHGSFPASFDAGIIEADNKARRASIVGGFPASFDAGIIEASCRIPRLQAADAFPASFDAGIIEARKWATPPTGPL